MPSLYSSRYAVTAASCTRTLWKSVVLRLEDWLASLGMSEYARSFVENDLDASVLRDLTDQDLRELGVSLGHRRKMLRAIAEMAAASSVARDNAERRQLTLMFCDLVDQLAFRPDWNLRIFGRSSAPTKNAAAR